MALYGTAEAAPFVQRVFPQAAGRLYPAKNPGYPVCCRPEKYPKPSPGTTTLLSRPRSNGCARQRGPGLELQMATRLELVKGGMLRLVGTPLMPAFLKRSVLAQPTSAQAY